jgi:dipeptidyl-peptidase-4
MNRAATAFGVAALAAGSSVSPAGGAADPDGAAALITDAETSGYARATPFERVRDIVRVLDASDLVSAGSIGVSAGGLEIPVLAIADPPLDWSVEGPEAGALGDRMPVLLFGSIHAGELCGTEALLMLAREVVASRWTDGAGDTEGIGRVLDDLVLLIVPAYNADGHASFGPSNRPGQNGPAEMGERANGLGLDLNRDWIKMDAPETRAMVGVLNTWDPAVIVDSHTTNGSNHRFTLTYQGPKHPAGDPTIITFVRDVMLPAVDERFEAATGYDAFFYGNFAENHTKWTTYPAEPWYGVAYRGIRNRLSILTEAYAYASFEDRVRSTEVFCEEILRYTAAHKKEIRIFLEIADDAETVKSQRGAPLAVKTEARAFAEPATILGYDEPIESGAHSRRATIDFETTPAKDYEVPIFNDFVPTEVVRRPAAYLVPREQEAVIDRLRAHGVRAFDARPCEDPDELGERVRGGAVLHRNDGGRRAGMAGPPKGRTHGQGGGMARGAARGRCRGADRAAVGGVGGVHARTPGDGRARGMGAVRGARGRGDVPRGADR